MGPIVHFVVDTNLFHECHKLDWADFPWGSIGAFDEIMLLVTDPVLDELDRQKKDERARVKWRAIEAVAWLRALLERDDAVKVFREKDPKVSLRVDMTLPSNKYPNALDYNVPDDKIVGIAAALAAAEPSADVRTPHT